uniref:MFS domain-containing protein n=1 Tax=Ganoderma boninense TaxID=34458 RepID=A0A5K1JVI7_9APHY|nr:MFS domain-containing protein [Ganoderma boninense]
MFKNAARKIAHNTTVPGLAGKQDLRSLQDLITAEKAVLNSLQRLSADFARASEALRIWGQGEGDDLGDTLIASNALLLHFSSALAVLANHETSIREQMKSVRTREENLDELKRRRRSLISDAEAADRKLNKMAPENKNLVQQTEHVNRLREEIRQMDSDIIAEEADLGDFKRAAVRQWMGTKFGGLLECCEKGSIVGELGKLVISEIPLEPTQPGLPRSFYTGHARTEFLVSEAARSVSEVVYSPEPDPNPTHRSIRPLPGSELGPVPSPSQQRRMSTLSTNSNPYGLAAPQPGYVPSPSVGYPGLPQVEETGFSIQQFIAQEPSSQSPVLTNPSVNEFGGYSSPPMANQPSTISVVDRPTPGPRGGRFATFPVKASGPRPQPSTNPYINAPPMQNGDRVPSIEIDRNNDESFASSVANALNQYSLDGSSGSAGPSSGIQPPHGPPSRDVKSGDFGPQRYSPPPPMYTPSEGQGLPAGAAPSNPPTGMRHHDDGDEHSQVQGNGNGVGKGALRPQSTLDEDEGLAYMSPGRGNESAESLADDGNRRVRFGGVTDVDTELERRDHEEEPHETKPQPPPPEEEEQASYGQRYARVPVPALDQGASGQRNGWTLHDGPVTIPSPPQPASPLRSDQASQEPSPTIPSRQARTHTPPATEVLMDDNALNAAAIREVSRELDSLMIGSPGSSPTQDRPPPSPISGRPLGASPSPFNRQRRDPSPLPPVNTGSPPGSSATSPKLDNVYVRERDRSMNSPMSSIGRKMSHDIASSPPTAAPASPTMSDGSDHGRPSMTIPQPSQASSNGTPYRTPMGTPSPAPMYNMPATTNSTSSFSAQGGIRTISAAAFRRQPPQQRNLSTDSFGPADISPLNVKKRPLPSSPYPYPSPLAGGLAPGAGPNLSLRGASPSPQPVEPRPVSHYRNDGEDEYDYISAYTDDPRASGYGSGRFATNVDDGNGIR